MYCYFSLKIASRTISQTVGCGNTISFTSDTRISHSTIIAAEKDVYKRQNLGRDPTLSELAAETGLTPEEIAQAEFANGCADSLSRETGDDGQTLEELLGDHGIEEQVVEHLSLIHI